MTSPRPESSPRIAALDSLRGVAILTVIASHFVPEFAIGQVAGDVVASLGRFGVLLFFLLSGYLIFRNLTRQPLAIFVSRRLFKIIPSYLVNVAVIALMGVVFADSFARYSPATYLWNAVMLSGVAKVETISGVYWTLFIEIKFYLLAAVFYRLFGVRRWDWLLAALILANAGIVALRGHGSQFLTFTPVFFVGIALFQAEQAGWSRNARIRLVAVCLIVSASLSAFDTPYAFYSPAYVVAETALFAWVLSRGAGNAALGFMGRISYSHYLYHGVIGYWLFAVLRPVWPIGTAMLVLAVFAATTLIAFLFYHGVEVPMVAVGKRCEGLFTRARPVAIST